MLYPCTVFLCFEVVANFRNKPVASKIHSAHSAHANCRSYSIGITSQVELYYIIRILEQEQKNKKPPTKNRTFLKIEECPPEENVRSNKLILKATKILDVVGSSMNVQHILPPRREVRRFQSQTRVLPREKGKGRRQRYRSRKLRSLETRE